MFVLSCSLLCVANVFTTSIVVLMDNMELGFVVQLICIRNNNFRLSGPFCCCAYYFCSIIYLRYSYWMLRNI